MKANLNFQTRSAPPARQRGISLLTTLVMLLAVMSLGISAMLVSKSEFMMTGNLQFQTAALNEAEASVSVGEQWLATGTNYLSSGFTTYVSPATGYQYPINYMTTNAIDPLTMTWDDTNSVQVTSQSGQRYLMELLAKDKTLIPSSLNTGGRAASGCNKVNIFRILSQGTSARGSSRFVQSIYSKLSC
jgi:Tfp pilus assembly protein PilX